MTEAEPPTLIAEGEYEREKDARRSLTSKLDGGEDRENASLNNLRGRCQ